MIDLKKDPTYKAKTKPESICVPEMMFIKVHGEGAPGSPLFQQAIQVVYAAVYTIKFWDKKYAPPKGYDKFTTPPLEAVWWTKDGKNFDVKKPEAWQWTVLIRVPDFVNKTFFKETIDTLVKEKKSDIYKAATLDSISEGLCVQMMHVGAYDKMEPSLRLIHDFVKENNYEIYGRHHEIYFNDPRRVAAEKLKTIIRYPIRKKTEEIILVTNGY